MSSLSLHGIKKRYGKVDVINGIDLDIDDGEFVVLVGPSGCGKSTLLRMVAGLEDITEGTLEIGGTVVNYLQPRDRDVAMVFQNYAIFPHMTVRENMGFGLTIARAPKKEKEEKVRRAAQILQMEHLLDRRPSQLSGGQRQRVAIGRAIVRNPGVFLFDEPLSNLDASLRVEMRLELGKLHRQLGTTMLYVTHDQAEAMTLADKIVVMKDGLAQQIGSPMDLFHNPENLFVATFIGSPAMNILEVSVEATDDDNIMVANGELRRTILSKPAFTSRRGEKLLLGIRPQHLNTAKSDDTALLFGTISVVERLGTETVVDLQLSEGRSIVASFPEDIEFQPGNTLALDFNPQNARLFPMPTSS